MQTKDSKEVLFYGKILVHEHLSKKNGRPIYFNRKTGKPFIGKSTRLNSGEDYLLLQLLSLRNNQKIYEPIRSNVRAMFIFGFKNFHTKKGIQRKTLPDLSNLVELPQDCLQKSGIIKNDTQICSLDGCQRIPAKENYLEIFLFKADD